MAAARMTTPLQGRVLSSIGSSLVSNASQKTVSTAAFALKRVQGAEARSVSASSRYVSYFSTLPVATGVFAANGRKGETSVRCMGTATAKEPTTSSDICEKIKHDHDELETFFKNYKECHKKGDDEEAHKWFNQFVWEVSRHAVCEELIFYPMLASKGEKGQKLADQSRADHQATKNILEELQKTSDPDEFDKKMDKMMSELREHIKMEESEDIPYLVENTSPSDRETAGNTFALGKNFVPSRPHAGVPNKPVALEAAVGLLLTPLDQLRNVLTPFPENPE